MWLLAYLSVARAAMQMEFCKPVPMRAVLYNAFDSLKPPFSLGFHGVMCNGSVDLLQYGHATHNAVTVRWQDAVLSVDALHHNEVMYRTAWQLPFGKYDLLKLKIGTRSAHAWNGEMPLKLIEDTQIGELTMDIGPRAWLYIGRCRENNYCAMESLNVNGLLWRADMGPSSPSGPLEPVNAARDGQGLIQPPRRVNFIVDGAPLEMAPPPEPPAEKTDDEKVAEAKPLLVFIAVGLVALLAMFGGWRLWPRKRQQQRAPVEMLLPQDIEYRHAIDMDVAQDVDMEIIE